MATELIPNHEQTEVILIAGEERPRNPFYIAVAETAARNDASGLPDPFPLEPLSTEIKGEPLSQTIIRDRGSY